MKKISDDALKIINLIKNKLKVNDREINTFRELLYSHDLDRDEAKDMLSCISELNIRNDVLSILLVDIKNDMA